MLMLEVFVFTPTSVPYAVHFSFADIYIIQVDDIISEDSHSQCHTSLRWPWAGALG